MIRLAIVEDHPAIAEGLAALLRDGRLDAPDLAGPAETEEES